MVVVTIEVWPDGDRTKARYVGLATITNDGTGDEINGSYDVTLAHSRRYSGKKGAYRHGRISHHKRSLSPYHLVAAALRACKIGPART